MLRFLCKALKTLRIYCNIHCNIHCNIFLYVTLKINKMRKSLRKLAKWYLIYSCRHKYRWIQTNYPDGYVKYKCEKCKKIIYKQL